MGIPTWFLVWFCFLFCSRFCLSQTARAGTTRTDLVTDYAGDIYGNGTHNVSTVMVNNGTLIRWPLWVAIPDDAGRYPVVQFQHGTELRNTDYTALISQVATWGFIVVAPQMYTKLSINAAKEISDARSILNWMQTGLIPSLPSKFAHHQPDFSKVALAGHSRGGLVVFGLALNYANAAATQQKYAAIVGLDPVDASWPVVPTILTHSENSLDVGVPSLVVGTGLGSKFPVCAPASRGPREFYRDVKPTAYYFNATDHGHMDFTDDCKPWDWDRSQRCIPLCRAGPSRQPLRQFAAGVMVAFLQDALMHNNASLAHAVTNFKAAPVCLDPPQSKVQNSTATSAAPLQYAELR